MPPNKVFRVAQRTKDEMAANIGAKDDYGKDRWCLAPYDAIAHVVKRWTIGAVKYEDRNWERGMKWSRCFDALMRHLTAWWQGEDIDVETGQNHLTAVAWNALVLLTFSIRGIGEDDRPKNMLKGTEKC